jgi:predicted transcriptional regulator YdeE
MDGPRFVDKGAFQVIGIETRTRNADEADSATARICGLWERFFRENVRAKIPHQVGGNAILAVYSDYESDEKGSYSLTIGCEVSSRDEVPEGLTGRTILASKYAVFTTEKGALPEIVIDAWQAIWGMDRDRLGGERRFSGDFEVYDKRTLDPSQAQVDIYIAIK